MKKTIVTLLLGICAVLLVKVASTQTTSITKLPPAAVSLEATKKLKRGKTVDFRVKIDLTAVSAPGTNQPAAIGSYVIPIRFDTNAFEFLSAGGGETSTFISAPLSVTNAQLANTSGVVTLVGAQTSSNSVTGTVSVATLSFRVIAPEKGSATISIDSELAAPGLSLASSALAGEPYRIPAKGESVQLKIK